MSTNHNAFFDLPSSSQKQSNSSPQAQSFFDIPSNKNTWVKPKPSISEQLNNAGPIFTRDVLATLYSLPSRAAEFYRAGGSKLQELGEKTAATEGREITPSERELTNKFVNYIPDLIKKGGEKAPYLLPSHAKAKEIIGNLIEKDVGHELPKEARGAIERAAQGAANATDVFLFPGSLPVKLAALGTSAATEAANLSEGQKLGANIGIPTAVSLAESLLRRRYIPPRGMEAPHQTGVNLGLTNEELAPIMATPGQVRRHGTLATGVDNTRQAYQNTGEALGDVLQGLQTRPSSRTLASPQVQQRLTNQLQDIIDSIMTRTHNLSPREQTVVDFLRGAINDIQANGTSPNQLIGTWRSMNRIQGGRSEIRRIERPIMEAMEAIDPQIAHDFTQTNILYSRYIQNLERLNPTQFNAFINAGELQNLLAAVFSLQPMTLGKQIANVASLNTLRRISSAILTNPQAQSLWRNFSRAVRDGRGASVRALGVQFKDFVQENLPEDYKEVDWEKLGID